jgi:hypothetical protein
MDGWMDGEIDGCMDTAVSYNFYELLKINY